jgi:hypothetical protein
MVVPRVGESKTFIAQPTETTGKQRVVSFEQICTKLIYHHQHNQIGHVIRSTAVAEWHESERCYAQRSQRSMQELHFQSLPFPRYASAQQSPNTFRRLDPR